MADVRLDVSERHARSRAGSISPLTNGARKSINISLGWRTSAPASSVVNAIDRATAAGVIVVISAGNDFEDHPDTAINPDLFAQLADTPQARGLVIIAGSVGVNNSRTPGADVISTFSNRAGNSATHYLAAVGESVRAPDQNNAAPFSGRARPFPRRRSRAQWRCSPRPSRPLTGAQIVSILLFLGARRRGNRRRCGLRPGRARSHSRAFQPLGASSVAGTRSVVSLGVNGTLSAPMGDARQGALGAVILDGYNRAFAVDLARTIGRNGPPLRARSGPCCNRASVISPPR